MLRTPTATERAALIDDFYTPYAEALARLVRDRLRATGKVTIIDAMVVPSSAYRLFSRCRLAGEVDEGSAPATYLPAGLPGMVH